MITQSYPFVVAPNYYETIAVIVGMTVMMCIVVCQELTRGNEALRNSFKNCTPVRVIRGQKDASSLNGECYTYLGLYHIVEMRYEAGMQGMLVYKFVLRRLPGQPQLPP